MGLVGCDERTQGGVVGGDSVSRLRTQLGNAAQGFKPDLPVFVGKRSLLHQFVHRIAVWLPSPKAVDISHLHIKG